MEKVPITAMLAPMRSAEFDKYYVVNYATGIAGAGNYSTKYKATYKPEQQLRLVERIPKCRLDGKLFLEGMKRVTAVSPSQAHSRRVIRT